MFIDNEYAQSTDLKFWLRMLNVLLTIALLFLLVWRFVIEKAIRIKRNLLPPHISLFRTPKLVLKLLLELLVCAVIVPPGVQGSFDMWEWKYYASERACREPLVFHRGSCYLVYQYKYVVCLL